MQVRVFIAMSLDGFIAGPNDEIDSLEARCDAEDRFDPFVNSIGARLMGRRPTVRRHAAAALPGCEESAIDRPAVLGLEQPR